MDGVTVLLTLLLSTEVVISLVATAYIVRVYHPVRGQAPFFDRLVVRDIRSTLAGAIIGGFAVHSLIRFAYPELNLAPILPPWAALLIGVPVVILLWGPIADAIAIWRERRSRDD